MVMLETDVCAPVARASPPLRQACPVCAGASRLLDVLDFNRTCLDLRLPLSGTPVYYAICEHCGFVFSPEFLAWRREEFAERVYNDSYALVDPDSRGARALANARFLVDALGPDCRSIDHLDFGGGEGALSRILQQHGWNSRSCDPFFAGEGPDREEPEGRFDLITAFEVMEHAPRPNELLEQLRQHMDQRCLVLFSTLLSDGNILPGQRLTWWYASPRNGHISLFSRASLSLLARRHGLAFGSLGAGLHYFLNQRPEWASRVLGD